MRELGVLVVDEDCKILSVIERMFGHFRVKVDCVMSATEALDRLMTKDYTTMITDLEMSDMDGLELAGKARGLFPDLNVVLFAGNTTEGVISLAFEPKVSEISELLLKPCGVGDMLADVMQRESGGTFVLK